MNIEQHFHTKILWEGMSVDDRHEFLSKSSFWDGFSQYQYEYLPEDLQTLLWLKTPKNDDLSHDSIQELN